ncbi:MAG TPA: hypothetical protein PKY12_07580 [Catalimonadaceae bacterium]|nr:hypothetical protein [Catalimonadaceae bacterium]
MNTTENQDLEQVKASWVKEHKRGKIAGGLFLILIGGLLLGREFGMEIPYWFISWKTFLIGMGIYLGIKNGYRSNFWIVPLLVGTSFLLVDFYPGMINRNLIWPVALIILGIFIMLKPYRNHRNGRHFRKYMKDSYRSGQRSGGSMEEANPPSGEPYDGGTLEFSAFMSGISKSILSKDFRRGEINAILGGAEVNFSLADFQQQAHLEVNAILGGVKLIIPANWEIRSEINCIMGGVEDNRGIRPSDLTGPTKILILEGNAIMGGIEIKSF